MNLQSVEIRKLFGQFDYTIALNREEGITILTGPNGYGKTAILKVIDNFFKQDLFFFRGLNFESIIFYFSGNKNVTIVKNIKEVISQPVQDMDIGGQRIASKEHPLVDIHFILKEGDKIIEKHVFDSKIGNRLMREMAKLNPEIERTSRNHFYDERTGNYIDIEDYILQIPKKKRLELIYSSENNNQANQLLTILSGIDAHLIEAQRLIRPSSVVFSRKFNRPVDNTHPFSYTIQNYAKELSNLIHEKQAIAFQKSQELDNSFPSRLMQNKKTLSEEEFNSRFKALIAKQQQLQQFGITISKIEIPKYNESKADVLSVYLDDSEEKTNFFDDLVVKINLFVTKINMEKFTHKKIHIDSDFGFCFKTDQGKMLNLIALSSGEQEEVVLLYEMLFRTRPNTLILIDEPEISLHVAWQKAFIDDLLAIAKIQHISFLLATHSPQIINGHWDMTTDLYELANAEELPKNE